VKQGTPGTSLQSEAQTVKCVVWDLDETIWFGHLMIGDRLRLRPGISSVLAGLDKRGIVHSVASRNEFDRAWTCLRNFGLADLFVAPEICFADKPESLARISRRLSISFRHMCFIDDDAFEREQIAAACPGIMVRGPESIEQLLGDPCFDAAATTFESRNRRKLLQAEVQRQEGLECGENTEAFLRKCGLVFRGRRAGLNDLGRVWELAQRTNRMNATGRRVSRQELQAVLEKDHGGCLLLSSLRDQYGEYGTVGCALVQIDADTAFVEELWISCRVAGRAFPGVFLSFIGKYVHECGAARLEINYRPTGENRLVAFHLGQYGCNAETKADRTICYSLTLPEQLRPFPTWMEVSCQS